MGVRVPVQVLPPKEAGVSWLLRELVGLRASLDSQPAIASVGAARPATLCDLDMEDLKHHLHHHRPATHKTAADSLLRFCS